MKRVLIITPHFPPINAPDMQRVRMSLPYYSNLGWEAEVLTVFPEYVEGFKDEALLRTVPKYTKVHRVKAVPMKLTRKLGLGSLSLRCYFTFKKKGDELLSNKAFDLIFFSTSMFHVCALGRHWKRKFGVPFVIDFQDPWRNDFYLDKPKQDRPPKFWMAYLLNKWMEAYTMPFVDGIISVSKGYMNALFSRYPSIMKRPYSIIPFGCSMRDFDIAKEMTSCKIKLDKEKINVVYVGAITSFFLPLIRSFFIAFKTVIPNYNDYRFWFVGTSYSLHSQKKMVADLADELGLKDIVHESPNRISYFEALNTMQLADILFIPGSKDGDYNASKVYNCILAKRPIFSIFNIKSEVVKVINEVKAGVVVAFNGDETEEKLVELVIDKMSEFQVLHIQEFIGDHSLMLHFTAEARTFQQTELFNRAIAK